MGCPLEGLRVMQSMSMTGLARRNGGSGVPIIRRQMTRLIAGILVDATEHGRRDCLLELSHAVRELVDGTLNCLQNGDCGRLAFAALVDLGLHQLLQDCEARIGGSLIAREA